MKLTCLLIQCGIMEVHAGNINFLMVKPLFIADSDFGTMEQVITLPAFSMNTQVDFTIIDDLILESVEEGFLALIQLENAMYMNLIDFNVNRLTLCRIRDNDSKLLK